MCRVPHYLLWLSPFLAAACDYSVGGVAPEEPPGPEATVTNPVVSCRDDRQCAPEERCAPEEGTERDLAALPLPEPPPCEDSTCPVGLVCQAPLGGSGTCQPRCDDAYTCPDYLVCGDTGHCIGVSCDDARHPGCPDGMVCDLELKAQLELPGGYRPYGTKAEHAVSGPPNVAITPAEQLSTCVFLRCDQPGARPCAEGFRCDPEGAHEQTTGCVPIPCGELGRCWSDEMTCEPSSSAQRPAGLDAHGCVMPNCEEGVPCPTGEVCAPERERSDDIGCAPARCDDPNGFFCDPERYRGCDPEQSPDGTGCVPRSCQEDLRCLPAQLCAPGHPQADSFGCVYRSILPSDEEQDILGTSGCQDWFDCEQGHCVSGICSASPGQCVLR